MEFKDKLPIIRKRKGMSQEKLAEMIGISRQAVAKWELGQGYPDIENLLLLSDIFKMSVDRLIKPEDDHYFLSYCKKEEISEEGLINFLLKAKRSTYAANAPQVEASRPNSHDLKFQEGEFLYIDTYLGGEEFGGEEAVWQQGIPAWTMNYYGRVIGGNFSGDFLKEALLLVPMENLSGVPNFIKMVTISITVILQAILGGFRVTRKYIANRKRYMNVVFMVVKSGKQ